MDTSVLEYGIAGGFAVLVLELLRRTLKDAAEERRMWMEQLKSEGVENRAALGRLSEVLIEMRALLISKGDNK